MSTVIRDGIIRISIQQGTVELKAPDLGPIIEQRKQEAAAVREVETAITSMAAAAAQAQTVYGGFLERFKSIADAQTSASENAKNAADAEATELERANQLILSDRARRHAQSVAMAEAESQAAVQAANEQQQAAMQVAKAQAEVNEGIMRGASGFMQLGRSVALFTSSDKDLQKIVQTLATFQGGIDLIRGASDVFAGTVKVLEQMQNARKLAATATGAETLAIGANTAAATANAAAQTSSIALLSAANPILLGIVAALAAAGVAWKLYQDAMGAASQEHTDKLKAQIALSNEFEAATRRNNDALKDFSTEQERVARLEQRVAGGGGAAARAEDTMAWRDKGAGVSIDDAVLEREAQRIQVAIESQRELLSIEQQKNQERNQALETQSREIEQQQRIAEQAQKALEIEEKKVKAFEAQFGALDKGDQKRLQKITDQVRGGNTESLKRSDLEFLGQSGGDQGRAIAQEEFARRGRDQGAGNTFAGIANPAVDQAAAIVDRENRKLNDLTGGKSAEDALSSIEDEKKALVESLDDMRKSMKKAVEPMVETLNAVADELKKIKQSIQNG